MWYTHPAFIICSILLLVIVVIFVLLLIKSKQLVSIVFDFLSKVEDAIPEEENDFAVKEIYTENNFKVVKMLCRLEASASLSNPNKISHDMSEMLARSIGRIAQIEKYSFDCEVEVLSSKIVFRANFSPKVV